MKEKVDWGIVSEKRNLLFGLAILSILVFHYVEDVYHAPDMMNLFVRGYMPLVGSVGVDVFLFLSGIGLWFSFRRKPVVRSFLKKRAIRLLIPYLIWGAIYWSIRDLIIEQNGVAVFLKDYSLLSFWTEGNRDLWFIGFMIAGYLLFPPLYHLLNRKTEWERAIVLAVLLILIWSLVVCVERGAPEVYANTEIALTRMPIFVIGIYAGKKAYEKSSFQKWEVLFFSLGCVVKFWTLLVRVLDIEYERILPSRLLQGWLGIVLVILAAVALKWLREGSWIEQVLLWLGRYSLELYMTHVTVRAIMNILGYETKFIGWYMICIGVSLMLSLVLKRVSGIIMKTIGGYTHV